jgi:hypothetical protein
MWWNTGGMKVYIKKYVLVNDKVVTEIFEGAYTDIKAADFSWKMIPEKGIAGWVQDNPPPRCTVMASPGMRKIANELLKKRREQG